MAGACGAKYYTGDGNTVTPQNGDCQGLPPIPAVGIGWLYPVCPTGYTIGIAPHRSSILMRVRTTLNLDDELIRRARELTGIQEKTSQILWVRGAAGC